MNFLTSLLIFLIPTFSLLVFQYFPYIFSFFLNPHPAHKLDAAPVSFVSSSVWCTECNRGYKCCQFQNLYFFPKEKTFGFVISEDSIIHGISSGKEFGKLLTTSVVNHTEFFLPLVVFLENDPLLKLAKSTLSTPVFLMNRFKPDNVMHALHDDILPLFSHFETLCGGDVSGCSNQNLLTFIDDYPDFNIKWYAPMAAAQILNLTSLEEPVLISKAHLGLPGDTVVYQYGFGQPQGPVQLSASSIGIYKRFAQYFRQHFNIPEKSQSETTNVLLITRKDTRRILNENELLNFVMQSFQNTHGMNKHIDIKELDLNAVKSISQIIAAFSESDLTIGMHGAATFLAGIFSSPNSTILELFPYGINSAVVSPLQSLSKANGCWFSYVAWENKDVRSTVPPPEDGPSLNGGLGSLTYEERTLAKKQVPVPAVHCCHNATYLYRMFQDTKVGPSVQYAILKSLEHLKQGRKSNWRDEFYIPGKVQDVVCLSEIEGTQVFWKPPLNGVSINHQGIFKYEITANSKDNEMLEVTEGNVFSNFESVVLKEIWVRACSNEICGPDKYVMCEPQQFK